MSNVPNQTLAALCGSRISAAHFPHGLWRTPLYLLLLSPVSSCEAASVDGAAAAAMAVAVVVKICVAPSGAVETEEDSPLKSLNPR